MESSIEKSARPDPADCGLNLPARNIPVPRSISAQAQAVLAAAAQAPMVWTDYPAPDDVDGWLEYVRTADANMSQMFGPLAELAERQETTSITVGAATGYRVIPQSAQDGRPGKVFLHVHGGALVAGGGQLCHISAAVQAVAMDAVVYAPDYRMPPHHPFPTPLDDCMAIYRHVLDNHDPRQMIVHGSSAGGNLAAAMLLRAKEEGLPLPAGLILETPELDLTESGDTFATNAIIDHVLQRGLGPVNRLYAGDADLSDPHLSPLFGDVRGFPPTLLTAGTRDMFLSNAARMLHHMRAAGVRVELLVYEAMPHGGFFGAPEDVARQGDIRQFADRCWATAK